MKNLFIYVRAGLLALAMLLIGSVFLASPASAHQGNITATAQCQPDGTYLVTYTLSWSQVPEAAYGTRILTREDTDGVFDGGWESNPAGYSWTDRGAITSPEGSISWNDTLPGTTLGAGMWEYAWLDWTNGNQSNKFHDTRVEDLGGNCEDTTTPEPVTVNASFGDNVCVGNVYTEPTLDAPEFPGTTREVTGTVAPGNTVTVTYTAQPGYVIEGQSVFEHTYPTEPASVTDCERNNQPEPVVEDRAQDRSDCDGVETREWQVVREYVWIDDEWVLGEPEIVNDTGWVKVRDLTRAEKEALGCLEVEGEEETITNPDQGGNEEQQPTIEVAPTQSTPDVPQSVDAGLPGDSWVAPAGPRWLAPLLGGVIILGLAAFTRLKQLGEQLA